MFAQERRLPTINRPVLFGKMCLKKLFPIDRNPRLMREGGGGGHTGFKLSEMHPHLAVLKYLWDTLLEKHYSSGGTPHAP